MALVQQVHRAAERTWLWKAKASAVAGLPTMTTVVRFMCPTEGKSVAYACNVLVGLPDGKTVVTNSDVLNLDLSDCTLVTVVQGGRFNAIRVTDRAAFLKKYLAKTVEELSL